MAIITIQPISKKTTGGFDATITGIDQTKSYRLSGTILTPGLGRIDVRWDRGGICQNRHNSCNIDMCAHNNRDLLDLVWS